MFSWIPLYQEISNWILQYRNKQNELCDILRKIDFTGNLEDEDVNGKKPLEVIDPFTFFAFFMKIKNHENRTAYLQKLKEIAELKSGLPVDYNGVPSAQPMHLWYFGDYEKNRGTDVIDNLWNLAEQAVAGELNEKLFQTVLLLPGIRIAKLSQGLFWLNPTAFYPIDAHKNYLEENGINTDVETLSDYLKILDKVKTTFQKPFYEVSNEAWRNNNEPSSGEKIKVQDGRENKLVKSYNMQPDLKNQALNTILYGPPGTGKTYNTINKAVGIANPKFDLEDSTREEIKFEYEKLVKEGQIEFITFHQSLSYEDFIEGIKPVEPKESDPFLKYEIKEGIFKRLAERASKVPDTKPLSFSISDEDFQKAGFYKISLGDTSNPDDDQIYEWCIQNGYIALGWGNAIDFTSLKENDIQQMVPDQLEKFAAQAVNYFIHYIKPADYIVVTYGNLQFRAIGRVTGNYEFKNVDNLNVHQFRKVEWLFKRCRTSF